MLDKYLDADITDILQAKHTFVQDGFALNEQRNYGELEELGKENFNNRIMKPFEEQYFNCWCLLFIASAFWHQGCLDSSRQNLERVLKISRRWYIMGKSDRPEDRDAVFSNDTICRMGFRFSLTTIHLIAEIYCRKRMYEEAEKTYRISFSMLDYFQSSLYGKQEKIKVYQELRDIRARTGNREDVLECCEIIMRTGFDIAKSESLDPIESFGRVVSLCMDTAVYLEDRGLQKESEYYLMETVNWIVKKIRAEESLLKETQLAIRSMGFEYDPEKRDLLKKKTALIRKSILEMQKLSIYPMMACANRLLKKGEKKLADRYYMLVRQYMERTVSESHGSDHSLEGLD